MPLDAGGRRAAETMSGAAVAAGPLLVSAAARRAPAPTAQADIRVLMSRRPRGVPPGRHLSALPRVVREAEAADLGRRGRTGAEAWVAEVRYVAILGGTSCMWAEWIGAVTFARCATRG